ncbi:hypothetical protein J7E96_09715 [Streptomyces sp. ISL-96]|uniref:hypothetical protein n=1 Tax=Streptomyces sp. ISL-96 TaxID=2819191 RepID=UPI001BE72E40|nr:hypothetical protein [Streptomyces sp. ISL-96]MBT2488794.1 hypothetical protein [Streptomyces sp. ISL-96]
MNREQIQDNYARQIERIENNRTYSEHAKRVMAAKVYQQSQTAMEQLRQQEIQAINNRREQLHRKMFGRENSADAQTVIARRDANDRAAQIDNPRIAAEKLQEALRQGDHTMAQALAQHAAGWGWSDVLTAYGDSQPGFREHVEEYNQLPDTSGSSDWAVHHTFAHVVVPPNVISDAAPHQIEHLAAQELEAA